MSVEQRRIATTFALTTIALIVVLGVHPVSTERILAGYVLALAAIGLAALMRLLGAERDDTSRFEQVLGRKPVDATRPSEVVRIEREITLGSSSAGNLHQRLLPLLRDAAGARLALDFDLHPARARAALGDDTWELLRPDRPVPEDRNAPGLPLRRVQSIVDELERL